jgi:hypothetical protein
MKSCFSFLILLILLVFSIQKSDAQNWNWALSSEYKGFDALGASYTNASGTSVFCGSYTDSIKLGAVELLNVGTHRFFIAVADANGNITHAFSDGEMGLTGEAYIYDITLDQEENIIIAGTFYSTSITFHGTAYPCVGPDELFIVKYTRDGDFLWARTFGSTAPGGEFIHKIVTDENNNIYGAGLFGESDLNFGSVVLPNTGIQNPLLVKYDADGNLLWAKASELHGNGEYKYARGACLALKSDGLFWMGMFKGEFTMGGQTIGAVDAPTEDIYIVSLTRDGAFNWVKKDGGDQSGDYPRNAVVLGDTMLLISGYYQLGDANIAGTTLVNSTNPSQVNTAGYLAAYRTDGTGKWAVRVLVPGTNENMFSFGESLAMVLDRAGDIWLAGEFAGEVVVGEELQYSVNNTEDIFMIKYHAGNGEKMDFIKTGNEKTEMAWSLHIDACDQLYCYGLYYDSLYIDDQLLYNPNEPSVFLATYETTTSSSVTGLTEKSDESLLLLVPNPAHDQLKLVLPESIGENFSVSICNAMGQEKHVYTIHSSNRQIELPLTVKPGIYMVQLMAGEKRYTSKLIVE